MNRLVTTDLASITPDRLPPPVRGRATRILFVSNSILGLTNYARQLEHHAEKRDDIDAVHVRLKPAPWVRLLGKRIPGSRGWDLHSYRHATMQAHGLRRWMSTRLATTRFDVIHVMTQGSAMAFADPAVRGGARLVVNVDATVMQEVRDFGYSATARIPMIRAERNLFDQTSLVVGWSRWVCESLCSDYGINPNRVTLGRAAMTLPHHPAHTLEGGRRPGPLRIAFVGNDWKRKGGPALLRAHQAHWTGRTHLHVFSSGAPVHSRARDVSWHGSVPNHHLLEQWLPKMDLLVMPTREDTLGWAILEASGVGLPVVASRIGGIPEVIDHGETGLLVDPGDDPQLVRAVSYLLEDADLRQRMGRAARQRIADDFDAADWYPKLLDRLIG